MTAEGVSNWERRVGNGLGEDGEGRSWEISGCGHNDVAGSRLRCSEKVNADTKGLEQSPPCQENQGKASDSKLPLAYL